MIEYIQANAEMTLEQIRTLSGTEFGYTREAIEWLEGYIERLRQAGAFKDDAKRDRLVSVFGSFAGECVVRSYGGVWTQRDGGWCVAFSEDNAAFPFAKVSKQMDNGLEDGIGSWFSAVPLLFKEYVRELPPESPIG